VKNCKKFHIIFNVILHFFQVKGYVLDKDDEIKWVVNGTWDNKVEIAPVTKFEGPIESPTCQTGSYIMAWQRQAPPLVL
jgi:hypothetical protein